MNPQKIVIVFLSILLFQSCLDLRTFSQDLSGKYICKNNSKAVNYLEIKDDGTFLHYFKKGNVVLTDKGTWVKSNDGYCEIELSEWKNYNELGEKFKTFGKGILWINDKYLDISPDGNSSSSFERLQK
jgi:hypothetical protein